LPLDKGLSSKSAHQPEILLLELDLPSEPAQLALVKREVLSPLKILHRMFARKTAWTAANTRISQRKESRGKTSRNGDSDVKVRSAMADKGRDPQPPLSEEYLARHTVGGLRPLSGPIRLVDYDSAWPRKYAEAAKRIQTALGDRVLRVEHVGSTAVPGLPAKPIIDIVVVVAESGNEGAYAAVLESAGYRLHLREPDWYEHRLFKGQNPSVNLHVFSFGCPEIECMVRFCDWLRTCPDDRELYARTKRVLAGQDWKYTQHYANAKSAVVEEIMSRALRDSRR